MDGWKLEGQAEVLQDFADDALVGEEGEQLAGTATVRADQDLEPKHTLHHLGPGVPAARAGLR